MGLPPDDVAGLVGLPHLGARDGDHGRLLSDRLRPAARAPFRLWHRTTARTRPPTTLPLPSHYPPTTLPLPSHYPPTTSECPLFSLMALHCMCGRQRLVRASYHHTGAERTLRRRLVPAGCHVDHTELGAVGQRRRREYNVERSDVCSGRVVGGTPRKDRMAPA
jgi:hypothetical protein